MCELFYQNYPECYIMILHIPIWCPLLYNYLLITIIHFYFCLESGIFLRNILRMLSFQWSSDKKTLKFLLQAIFCNCHIDIPRMYFLLFFCFSLHTHFWKWSKQWFEKKVNKVAFHLEISLNPDSSKQAKEVSFKRKANKKTILR